MSYEQFTLVMKRERKTTMRDLMSSFKRIDLNGDGYITAHELHRVLTKVGPTRCYGKNTTFYLQFKTPLQMCIANTIGKYMCLQSGP